MLQTHNNWFIHGNILKIMIIFDQYRNRIGGVMVIGLLLSRKYIEDHGYFLPIPEPHWWQNVIVMASSAVDSWFEPSRVKPKTIKCVFVVSPPRPIGSHEEGEP